jgi:hypothetical protein
MIPLMLAVVTPCAMTVENPARKKAIVTSKYLFIELGLDIRFWVTQKYPFANELVDLQF